MAGFWKKIFSLFKRKPKPSSPKPSSLKPSPPKYIVKYDAKDYDEYDDYDFGFDFDLGEEQIY